MDTLFGTHNAMLSNLTALRYRRSVGTVAGAYGRPRRPASQGNESAKAFRQRKKL
jgi:hypothetical protein